MMPLTLLPSVISIHAPPRGATIPDDVDRSADFISIHAPPRGATALVCVQLAIDVYFNSRPSARGDDLFEVSCTRPRFISIHAPPRGATGLSFSS